MFLNLIKLRFLCSRLVRIHERTKLGIWARQERQIKANAMHKLRIAKCQLMSLFYATQLSNINIVMHRRTLRSRCVTLAWTWLFWADYFSAYDTRMGKFCVNSSPLRTFIQRNHVELFTIQTPIESQYSKQLTACQFQSLAKQRTLCPDFENGSPDIKQSFRVFLLHLRFIENVCKIYFKFPSVSITIWDNACHVRAWRTHVHMRVRTVRGSYNGLVVHCLWFMA